MRVPKYRKHSSRNFAFVEIQGKRIPLPGAYDSAESKAAYHDYCAKLNRGTLSKLDLEPIDPESLKVAEVAGRFLEHAETLHDGGKRGDFVNNKNAVSLLLEHSATIPVAMFGAKRLKAFQAWLIAKKRKPPHGKKAEDMPTLSRTYINDIVSRVKGLFKWAVSEEIAPPSTWHALQTVRNIKKGQAGVRDLGKRKPVSPQHVLAIRRFVPRVVFDMLRLQMLTGARSRSVCLAQPDQFDISGELWLWRPRHKTEKSGVELILPIGPKCQKLLASCLAMCKPGNFLFSPRTVRKDSRYRKRYDSQSYRTAVARGIKKANAKRNGNDQIPPWSPHQVRHQKGTAVNNAYGLEAAQAILGHDSLNATKVYRSTRLELAKKVARETG